MATKVVGVPVDLESGTAEAAKGEIYHVTVEDRTLFRYDGCIIKVVNKYGHLHGHVQPDTVVLKVGDVQVTDDNFDKIYEHAQLPMKLELQRPSAEELELKRRSTLGNVEEAQVITKELLVSLILMYFSAFIDMFGMLVSNPVLPFLMPVMGFSEVQLGMLTTFYNLASIPGIILIGILMTRCGTRVAMLFSLLGSAVTLAAQGALIQWVMASEDPTQQKYYYIFLALRLAAGATGSSMPVAMTFIGMKVPREEKAKHFALCSGSMAMAIATAPMVGGTLADFTPQFSLPFYVGAIFAFCGFVAGRSKLMNAKKPPSTGKRESFTKPIVAMISVIAIKMLCYGAFIVMGVAYYMWKFELQPAEVGSMLSLHGVITAINHNLFVPRLVKKFGAEQAFMMGTILMVVGSAIVGFMETLWAFQAAFSLVLGVGFSIVSSGGNVVCDKYATQATRGAMNSAIFAVDNMSLFASGLIYGKMLQVAKAEQQGYLYWLTACGFATLLSVAFAVVWKFMLLPVLRKRKSEEEKMLTAAAQHKMKFVPEPEPTDSDYMQYGKFVVDLLQRRSWSWRSKREYIEALMELFLVELPTDTLEHRMDVIWELREKARQASRDRKTIDEFYDQLSKVSIP